SEAALELEIAKQYPDVHFNPGYSWDQGTDKYAFGFSLNLPLLDQNQGPIAEAAARRSLAEARFSALQNLALSEADRAVTRYHQSLSALAAADQIWATVIVPHLDKSRRAVELGEADRLTLLLAEIQAATWSRSQLAAWREVQLALGLLEDSLQRPLASGQTRQ
ncbi:MAG TPA: TolC family protein, partial [Verrucomicrobiae bacterium]|nr:TolC family protein [Verrucomicrobiae bacterium]